MTDKTTTPDLPGGTEAGSPAAAKPSSKPSWLLPAVLAAVACVLTWSWVERVRLLPGALSSLDSASDAFWLGGDPLESLNLTAEARFLLEGDESRNELHERRRAIWEAQPTNRVYLGNYLSALASGLGQKPNRLDFCRREIAAAREVDPDNARLDYLEAAWILESAANLTQTSSGSGESGDKKRDTLEVLDRAALDEAMALLIEGTKKPEWRRYSADMLQLQFDALGSPRRLIDLIQRVAVAAGTLLPDLAECKKLSRASRLYAELLIAEGRPEDAIPFLEAWHPITLHLAEDSFTLIDVLVVGALAKDAGNSVPPIYREMGREDEEVRTATLATALGKPTTDWRQQRETATEADKVQSRPGQQVIQERGGELVRMLLPALGTWPEESEYASSRRLEYAAATEGLLALLCVVFLAIVLICLAATLRWRLLERDPASHPVAMMPGIRDLSRILILGVLVPLAAFLLITRLLPMSGHAWSAEFGEHKLLAEGGLLISALIVLPIAMTARLVRQRCDTLATPTTGWYARYLFWPFALGAATLALIWLCPATEHEVVKVVAWIAAGVIGLSFVIGALLTLAQGFAGQKCHGRFYGTTCRTMIPVLALVVMVLGLAARSYLGADQARCLAQDTLLNEPDRPGFTRVENELVDQLKAEIMAEARRQRRQ